MSSCSPSPTSSPTPSSTPLTARAPSALRGTCRPPGDKSLSHRAIMFGGLAEGTTTVEGLLEGDDVLATVAALRALGATLVRQGEGAWTIHGTGGVLHEPSSVLDMGNSGTSARLLLGILATQPFTSILTGDASLVKRPMARVIEPLSQTGATFLARSANRLPLAVRGSAAPRAIRYRLPVASAQVKSAILLAGLFSEGTTVVHEPIPTRDHTERLLKSFGVAVTCTPSAEGGEVIALQGRATLRGCALSIPSDISSAAFPLVAALVVPDSEITLQRVGLNPRRAGLLESLREMGAAVTLSNEHDVGGEPVADVHVRASTLQGATIPPERAPSMIDEYPILAVAAACALGVTRLCGLGELRVKESDRLSLMAQGLAACGVTVAIEGDDLIITGDGIPPRGGAQIATQLDHRIAMSFLVLSLVAHQAVTVDDATPIATSFPNFVPLMTALGTRFQGF